MLDLASLDDWDDGDRRCADESVEIDPTTTSEVDEILASDRGAGVTEQTETDVVAARHRGGGAGVDRAGRGPVCSRSWSSCRSREVEALCDELARRVRGDGRGFVLAQVAGGYRFQTHPDLAPYVERFVLEGQHARLSGPALETLAIVAYKQPISRGQMSAIRGVNVEATLTTLLQRGYVAGGRAAIPAPAPRSSTAPRASSSNGSGCRRSSDLPPLGDFVPDASVVEALERGLRVSDDPDRARRRRDADAPTTASTLSARRHPPSPSPD